VKRHPSTVSASGGAPRLVPGPIRRGGRSIRRHDDLVVGAGTQTEHEQRSERGEGDGAESEGGEQRVRSRMVVLGGRHDTRIIRRFLA